MKGPLASTAAGAHPRRASPTGVLALTTALSLCGTAACGVRELAPPATPEKRLPELEDPPPPPGEGRGVVVVDATNGPAKVYEVLGASAAAASIGAHSVYVSAISTRLVCATTPCSATGALGAYTLLLEPHDQGKVARDVRDTVTIDLRRRPTIVRHTFGEGTKTSALYPVGLFAMTLGLTSAALGTPAWLVGLSRDSDQLTTWGGGLVGAGAVTLAIGLVMMVVGQTTHQSGSTTHWTLPSDKNAPPAPSTESYPGTMTF